MGLSHSPFLQGVRGTYRFDVENAGSWVVAVDDGAFKATESKEEADCVIQCTEDDFLEIVEGKRNLMTSAMRGSVRVSGDIALAQKFHGFVSRLSESKAPKRRAS